MVAFIIFWLGCGVLSFLVHSVLKCWENKEYTLRDVIMGILLAIGGPFYLMLSSMAVGALLLFGVCAFLEMFLRDEDMYSKKVLLTTASITNIFRRRK